MKKPNILLITTDQQHWDTIGAFNSCIQTPNIDRLVREGTMFSRAYCTNPTCTPARASIITGKYPSQHGAWSLGTKLPESENTIGDELIRAGYRTALVGKAHFQPLAFTKDYSSLESYPILHDLEFWKEYDQKFYGFERSEMVRNHTSEAHAGQHYALWLEEKGCKNWRDYFVPPTGSLPKAARHTWSIPEEFHYNTFIAERTNALLEEYNNSNENFFIWASFPDPHPPYLVPKPWDTMYDPEKMPVFQASEGEHGRTPPYYGLTQEENPDFSSYLESGYFISGFHSHVMDVESRKKDVALYYAMISFTDKYVGVILDRLDELGLADDTIVVFTTDHGQFIGQHGLTTKGPFHYEDMIRIPFITRYPDHIPAGQISESLQSLVDLAPTFLSIAGLSIPRAMTGKDQAQVWLGGCSHARDHILCENRQEATTVNLKTYVDTRYKITVHYRREYGAIYDLQEDPDELYNLWDDPKSIELKAELLKRLVWAEMEKEPMWMPKISGA